MQQSNDRKRAIDKRITETRNKKRKASIVGLTTENKSVVAATTTVFMNAHQSQNENTSISVIPNMNVSSAEANIQAATTANHSVHMGDQNANNRDDMSHISYYDFGNIIN